MPVKYVFVTGGVVSGFGKGITAASLGRIHILLAWIKSSYIRYCFCINYTIIL